MENVSLKTNTGLSEFCQKCLDDQLGYVWGTFGQLCTTQLLDQKANQYPNKNQAGGQMRTLANKWLNRRVMDCCGLIKYYLMTNNYGEDPQYIASFDVSAEVMYNRATKKGPIGNLPEVTGILLHAPGHVGVYIGNGYVIEAKGTDTGVIKSSASSKSWNYWYQSTFISYGTAELIKRNPIAITTVALNLRSGAGINFPIITALPKGTHLTIIGKYDAEWLKVIPNSTNNVGYCSKKYLEIL